MDTVVPLGFKLLLKTHPILEWQVKSWLLHLQSAFWPMNPGRQWMTAQYLHSSYPRGRPGWKSSQLASPWPSLGYGTLPFKQIKINFLIKNNIEKKKRKGSACLWFGWLVGFCLCLIRTWITLTSFHLCMYWVSATSRKDSGIIPAGGLLPTLGSSSVTCFNCLIS